MREAARFVSFVIVAGLAHLALALALPAGVGGGGAGKGGASTESELTAADAEIAALVEQWERPPETGTAADLGRVRLEEAADLSAAEQALAAVEAGAATEALAETGDPGPTPDRPVMAALPTPPTEAPQSLRSRTSEPALSAPRVDSAPESPGGARRGPDLGAMSALGAGGSPGASLPQAPAQAASLAPERTPLPSRRAKEGAATSADPGPGPGRQPRRAQGTPRLAPDSPALSAAGSPRANAPAGPESLRSAATPATRAGDGTAADAAVSDDAAHTGEPAADPLSAAQDREGENPEESAAELPSAASADEDETDLQDRGTEAARAAAPGPSAPLRQGAGDASDKAGGADGAIDPREAYGARVRASIDREKRYPDIARLREREGVVVLSLMIARDGALAAAAVAETSGDAGLDGAALAAARAVGRYPRAPATLTGGPFSLRVPVAFRLR